MQNALITQKLRSHFDLDIILYCHKKKSALKFAVKKGWPQVKKNCFVSQHDISHMMVLNN